MLRCLSLLSVEVVFLYRYKERSEIEALYFHINTLLKSLNQPAFAPQDGQLIHDLERNWEGLEHAEHRREVALRQELLRQERLEQLNYKFERKVSGRQCMFVLCTVWQEYKMNCPILSYCTFSLEDKYVNNKKQEL